MGAAARTRSPSARHAAASPTARRGPPPAQAPGRLPHHRQQAQLRRPGAAAISDLHPDDAAPAVTATVTVSPRPPDRLYRTLLPKSSLTSRITTSPHGCPGRAPRPRSPGRPAPAPAARPASRSPGPPPQPSAHPPSPAARAPGKSPGPPGRTHGDARSTQRRTSSRDTPPERPVRGRPWKADGAHRPSARPGRRPLYVRGCRDTAPYSDPR